VVTIIGILSGLLLPALAVARKRAWRTGCMNNLKQIGIASQMYVNDNNDYVVPIVDDTFSVYWFGRLVATDQPIRRQDGLLQQYLKNRGTVEMCPAFASYVPIVQGGGTSYGYNYWFLSPFTVTVPPWGGYYSAVKFTAIEQPGRTVLMADSARDYNGILEENWYLDPPRELVPGPAGFPPRAFWTGRAQPPELRSLPSQRVRQRALL